MVKQNVICQWRAIYCLPMPAEEANNWSARPGQNNRPSPITVCSTATDFLAATYDGKLWKAITLAVHRTKKLRAFKSPLFALAATSREITQAHEQTIIYWELAVGRFNSQSKIRYF